MRPIVFIATLLILCSGCTRERLIMVPQADFVAHQVSSLSDKRDLALSGHRVLAGKGLVIGSRIFKGNPLLPDSGRYEKMTAWVGFESRDLDEIRAGKEVRAESVFVFWSAGHSASPNHSGCWAWTENGSLVITKISDASASFVLGASPTAVKDGPAGCANLPRSMSGTADLLNVREITAWLGKPGLNEQEEAIP